MPSPSSASPAPTLTRRRLASAALAALGLAASQAPVHAAEHSYTFTGLATVGAVDGGPPVHPFTGLVTYQDDVAPSTVYRNNAVVQGFTSDYLGAVSYLGITLDNGEHVEATSGWLQVNNIQQAEVGAPVSAGLTLQVWTGGASGTINDLAITNLYLAFLPVAPGFTWDALDGALGGNAEQLLGNDASLLPATVDPVLTGTAIPGDWPATFVNGLFLGTNHALTNTVNPVFSITDVAAPVPEPAAWALWLAGGLLLGLRSRRRDDDR